MDNRMFAVLANLGGSTSIGESCGLSGAWGPEGRRLTRLDITGPATVKTTLQHQALAQFHRSQGGSETSQR
jgi:predicted amidohydrolase